MTATKTKKAPKKEKRVSTQFYIGYNEDWKPVVDALLRKYHDRLLPDERHPRAVVQLLLRNGDLCMDAVLKSREVA